MFFLFRSLLLTTSTQAGRTSDAFFLCYFMKEHCFTIFSLHPSFLWNSLRKKMKLEGWTARMKTCCAQSKTDLIPFWSSCSYKQGVMQPSAACQPQWERLASTHLATYAIHHGRTGRDEFALKLTGSTGHNWSGQVIGHFQLTAKSGASSELQQCSNCWEVVMSTYSLEQISDFKEEFEKA